jgi:GNAT superfamily N-acetyltransferase
MLSGAFKHGLIAQRVLDRVSRTGLVLDPYVLFREGVRPHQTEWPDLASEFSSSVLDASDLPAVAACVSRTEEQIRARLHKGHLCVVLKHGSRIAGYTWADSDEVNDAACDYELRPGEAYLYDAFIAPEFRGRGLAPYLRVESYRHLRQAGKHTFYSISDYFNSPAIRFKEKLNAEAIRVYLQIKLGDRQVGHWLLRDLERRRTRGAPSTDSAVSWRSSASGDQSRTGLKPGRTPPPTTDRR